MFLKSIYFKLIIGFVITYIVSVTALNRTNQEWLLIPLIISAVSFPVLFVLSGQKFAPAPFNNFTTWVGLLFVGIVALNIAGQDDKNILITLVGLDMPYRWLLDLFGIGWQITTLGFALRIALGLLYGAIIDGGIWLMKR